MGKASRAGRIGASRCGKRVARNRRAPSSAVRSSAGCLNTASTARATNGTPRTGAMVARVASSSSPYGTPDGQAVSQARQPRHRSICCAVVGSSSAISPSSMRRMSTSRPRGESFSSSRFTYVGHACRQKPQCTQASSPLLASASGVPGSAHFGDVDTVLIRLPWRGIPGVAGSGYRADRRRASRTGRARQWARPATPPVRPRRRTGWMAAPMR